MLCRLSEHSFSAFQLHFKARLEKIPYILNLPQLSASPYSFIYSNKNVLSPYYVPGAVLGSDDAAVNETSKVPLLMGLTF